MAVVAVLANAGGTVKGQESALDEAELSRVRKASNSLGATWVAPDESGLITDRTPIKWKRGFARRMGEGRGEARVLVLGNSVAVTGEHATARTFIAGLE